MPEAFLRQARIAHRRGETERAIMFARRASHDAPKGDAVQIEARAFLEAQDASAVASAAGPEGAKVALRRFSTGASAAAVADNENDGKRSWISSAYDSTRRT